MQKGFEKVNRVREARSRKCIFTNEPWSQKICARDWVEKFRELLTLRFQEEVLDLINPWDFSQEKSSLQRH